MKALLQAGGLSNYVDVIEPEEKLAIKLPIAQNVFQNSLNWSHVDSLIFKLAHISEVGGEKVAVYRYYEPQLAIRNDKRLLLLEKENRNQQEKINELHSEINRLKIKYETTDDDE